MKKFVLRLTSALICLMMLASFVGCGGQKQTVPTKPVAPPTEAQNDDTQNTQTVTDAQEQTDAPEQTDASAQTPAPAPIPAGERLFIGDSRTVGLSEYSQLKADFFASIGMTVYNIHDDALSVPSVGKVTFNQLLTNKDYDTIYLMVGINELGYDMDNTASVYEELVEEIKELQPNARLILQANLHVTQAKSNQGSYISNKNIDLFNDKIHAIAEKQKVFYLDVNRLFDSGSGALSDDVTSDGVHPYGTDYVRWGEWIEKQSADLVKEG